MKNMEKPRSFLIKFNGLKLKVVAKDSREFLANVDVAIQQTPYGVGGLQGLILTYHDADLNDDIFIRPDELFSPGNSGVQILTIHTMDQNGSM